MNDPKFVILVSLDEPKGLPETGGYATAGWVAAPSVKSIIESIVSLYGILPGDLKEGLPPIEIASTPVPAPAVAPQFVPANARLRAAERRKALAARSGAAQTAAAPATGVRRVATE
jgi:cell division protein FtsI (penicillin-binding protein 3)